MKLTPQPPPIQPPDGGELREALAEMRRQIAVCPGLDDATIGSLFGFSGAVAARQRLRVERKRLVIHDDI